ncbi:MAG TPA: hypothetical protein VFV32_13495 [Acidimicrobiales bacterium]|nr:hypothetical protein [Acidimicrobiales bacterium]
MKRVQEGARDAAPELCRYNGKAVDLHVVVTPLVAEQADKLTALGDPEDGEVQPNDVGDLLTQRGNLVVPDQLCFNAVRGTLHVSDLRRDCWVSVLELLN